MKNENKAQINFKELQMDPNYQIEANGPYSNQ